MITDCWPRCSSTHPCLQGNDGRRIPRWCQKWLYGQAKGVYAIWHHNIWTHCSSWQVLPITSIVLQTRHCVWLQSQEVFDMICQYIYQNHVSYLTYYCSTKLTAALQQERNIKLSLDSIWLTLQWLYVYLQSFVTILIKCVLRHCNCGSVHQVAAA